VKHARISFVLLAAGLVFSSCKAPEPEFGIPDDPEKGLRGRFSMRDESWGERRQRWKVREREKSQQMFNRMRDEY
jgi:hypothetical protein